MNAFNERRAVGALEEYLIKHAMDGFYADKVECIHNILERVNEGQMPDRVCGDDCGCWDCRVEQSDKLDMTRPATTDEVERDAAALA